MEFRFPDQIFKGCGVRCGPDWDYDPCCPDTHCQPDEYCSPDYDCNPRE